MDGATRVETKKVFTTIYDDNLWEGESRSGPGSTMRATTPLRPALSSLFADLDIRTLIDAPCGTAEWITDVTGGLAAYLGFDIVDDVVRIANRENTRRNHFFMVADLLATVLPKGDAILCRDCLVHLPLEAAQTAVANFRASGSTYLLATTFPSWKENTPIQMGWWRPLNLQLPPFDFPAPIRLLPDRVVVPDDQYADKSIGVWRLSDL